MIGVTWYQAYAFAAWLTPGGGLPTEAEWEHAARGGHDGRQYPCEGETVCGGSTCLANVREAEIQGRTPVCYGRFKPNDFGLCDMAGNVWEWTADWYAPYADEKQTDPRGPPRNNNAATTHGRARVIRGGSFDYEGWVARCADRLYGFAWDRDGSLGFRVVRPAAPSD